MKWKVEVINNENIKPSFPTPANLRNLKLSLIDQFVPAIHVPLVLFYSSFENTVESQNLLNHLKKSLSETLTYYYPLAGRIDGNYYISCNDEGVGFSEARVQGQINKLLNHPKQEELMELVPKSDNFYGSGPKVLLSVQANIFDCGGMALGVCISHKALDASSISLFLNSWAALARGTSEIIKPRFDTAQLFPPRDGIPAYAQPPKSGTKKLILTKRFVFNEWNIAALKAKCSSHFYIENPSRVEAVIALLWMCGMNVASVRKEGAKQKSVANIAVNLRGRMNPPLSNMYFGNISFATSATSSIGNHPELLHSLVDQVHKAITKVDSHYVKKLQYGDEITESLHTFQELFGLHMKGELELYTFTSWCRLPINGTDFGWGKPDWTTGVLNGDNAIFLMDTICGKGVEAWVALEEEDMACFELNPEFIAFASGNQMS